MLASLLLCFTHGEHAHIITDRVGGPLLYVSSS